MTFSRAAGVLLHPTSLPSDYCIGELGSKAFGFIDFLADSNIKLWQILPLGPTGYGNSPYAAMSTFAGNPFLISLEILEKDGYLSMEDLDTYPGSKSDQVDYGLVENWKMPLLEKAAREFINSSSGIEEKNFGAFCSENSSWLDDFALFLVIKKYYDLKAENEGVEDSRWNYYWDKKVVFRDKGILSSFGEKYSNDLEVIKILQYFFFKQWQDLKKYANKKGIKIIGDLPIYVAACSSDLWSNSHLFHVDKEGKPSVVAGVPPDYFSKTGQLWGNPIYRWKEHEKNGFSWWINRIEGTLKLVDIVRIDHFIGLERYWEVPADAPTAESGKWVKASGRKMLEVLKLKLGDLPVIAEDLGVITEDVETLRDDFGFPGMKILQFAFSFKDGGIFDTENIFLPFNYSSNTVVYTGTHDNDTTRGWYNSLSDNERDLVRRYLGRPDSDIVWDLIREALSSVAKYAVIPLQDILDLDSKSRMNKPSTIGEGNWSWRFTEEMLNEFVSGRLSSLVELYGR